MTWLLLLLSCASPIWQECYPLDEAYLGVELEGYPLAVEMCDSDGMCYDHCCWNHDESTLYVYEMVATGDDPDLDAVICVVWGG
jgi:hypothetical protein